MSTNEKGQVFSNEYLHCELNGVEYSVEVTEQIERGSAMKRLSKMVLNALHREFIEKHPELQGVCTCVSKVFDDENKIFIDFNPEQEDIRQTYNIEVKTGRKIRPYTES